MTDNIRLTLDQAFGENPDQYARDREIGRGLGMPPRLLNDSDRSIYRAIQSDTALQGLPVTRRFYGNYDNAVLAQDDSENLGKIEHRLRLRQVREWGEEHRIRANEPGFMSGAPGEAWGNIRKIPTAMAANTYDSWAESWRRRIQREEAAGTLTPEKRQQYEAFARQYDTRLGAEQEEIKSINAGIRENAPRNLALWQKMVRGAFTSSPYSLGALAVSIATGNPFAGPLAMGYAVGETGRAEARMDGLSYEDAWRKGAIDGVAEAVFEWLPMRHMLKLYVGNSATRQAARTALQEEARAAARMSRKEVLQTFGKAARSDALGENATQLIQDLNNLYYGLDPELQKAIDEHGLFSAEVLKIQGERQLVATGSSVITSVALGGPRLIADMKQRHNDGLDNLDATAEAVRNSRTRERAPDVFDQYVRDLVEDSDLGDIYADGNALHQDGLDEALAEALPERAEEIRAAVENGGAVQIPLEDYLSRIAPNEELTNALRPHIRDADGMSAQELDNNALGELEQDIRNEVTRLAAEDTRAAEIQALEQSIIEQMNTAGQTTEEANRTYATLYTANVDVFSRQMNLSPQEYHAQYGIHIAGGNIVIRTQAGEQTLTPAEAARRLAAGAEAAVQGGQNAGTANNTQDIDAEVVSEAARFGGMDIAGYQRAIAHDAVAIQQENGKNQNVPLTDADRTTINDTIANPEVRVYGLKTPDGQRALVSVKALPEGGVAVVEEVLAGGKTLAVKSLRRYTGDTQQTLKALAEETWGRGNREAIFNVPVTPGQASYQQAARSVATRTAYEARIDELFAGEPASAGDGVTVLDRSDILDMLGFGDTPVRLAEGKVIKGQANHPKITAEYWKKIPEWLENPALVFDSDTENRSLVFIAPELVDGNSVRIILVPSSKELEASVVINAYDANVGRTFEDWAGRRKLRYADTKRASMVSATFGRQLPDILQRPEFKPYAQIHGMGRGHKNSPRHVNILTEKNLGGYRKRKAAQEAAQQNPAQDSYLQNYRRNNRDVPFNDVPYMMFADDAESIASYGKNLWELPDDVGNRISASATAFREALGKYLRENIDRLRESGYGAGLTDEELVQNLVDEADPGDIVDSAGLWDINEDWLMNGIMEEVLQPNGWNVVDTSDGALAFDPELVRRVDMDEEGNIIDYIPPQATTEEEQAIKAGREQLREAEAELQESEERNAKSRKLREKVEADIRARGQEPGENYWEAFDLDTEKSAYFADRESARAWADEQAGNDPGRFSVYEHAMPSEEDTTALQEQVAALQEYAPQTLGQYLQEQATPRGAFSPDTNTITLTPNADLSTFIHELGHYFLETLTRHATELRARNDAGEALTDGQKQIIKDADTILANLGGLDLDTWHSMSLEEKRSHHELAARQFEAYILEGKAPSLELQGAFQRFRAWLFRIYKAARNLNAPLNDEVRQVFDRMLATSDAIELAEQNRSMMQLFASPEEAGMTPEQFAEYQQQGRDATQAAQDEMQARALRDTQYIRNLRNKALRHKQQEAKAARQQAEMQARQMVLNLPVYRVWQFLSGTMTADTTIASNRRAWTDAVDPAHDDLNTAIAKLGGLNREAVEQEWGLDPKDRIPDIRPGFPVLRRNGGLSVDGMRQALVEQGYLNDSDSLNDFYAVFDAQQRGQPQYSHQHQPDPGSGKAGENAHLHDLPTLRLDHNALLELGYSEAQIKQLGRKVSKTGGVHPDLVAELFQDEDGNALYDSGDAMVQALLAAKRPRDAINDVADDIMLQQFGELATPQAVAFAADMAVHNDIRLRVIASEANALAKAVGNKTLLNRAARQLAQETIAAKRLRDIHPAQYTRMEARAAKAAAQAQKKGDIATAAAEKRNQLLQAHLARAAYEAQEEAATHLRYLKRMSRLNPKHIDIKQREQIEGILERYNLRDQTKKALDRTQSLGQWVEEQRQQGFEPNLSAKTLDELRRMPWQHMNLTDLRGLVADIKQIEYAGKRKKQLFLNQQWRDYNATVEEVVAGIKANARRTGIENRTPTTPGDIARNAAEKAYFAHLRPNMQFREMDGNRDNGPMYRIFTRPTNERANWQTQERARATEVMNGHLQPLLKRRDLNSKRAYSIGGKTRSFTPMNIFAIALNYGNESNAQRMRDGEQWTDEEIKQLVGVLTAEELHSVQAIWDEHENYYKPKIAEVERRTTGVEPEWVEARPFTVTSADGQTVILRGGYYPLRYDNTASVRTQQTEDAITSEHQQAVIAVRRGFTKSRVAEVHDRPLVYDLSGIYSGLDEVIHYLAWHEWSIDIGRLLRSKRISDAIRDSYGDNYYQQLVKWARDISAGDLRQESMLVRGLNRMRKYGTPALLGYNLMSATMQPLGLLQTAVRVGTVRTLNETLKYLGNPLAIVQKNREANEASVFMANRSKTQMRELNELYSQMMSGNRAKRAQNWMLRNSYVILMLVQKQVDVITWHAARNKALEEGRSSEDAVSIADQAVIDTQGSGMTKDLSAIERDGYGKAFTVFYSYMNAILNLEHVALRSKDSIAKKAEAVILLSLGVPILSAMFRSLLKPGDSDDWDKDNWWRTIGREIINHHLGLFALTREFQIGKFDYKGPVGLHIFADAGKFVNQLSQGEFDKALLKAGIGLLGATTGIPSAAINRIVDGLDALQSGETDNPAVLLYGQDR